MGILGSENPLANYLYFCTIILILDPLSFILNQNVNIPLSIHVYTFTPYHKLL